MSLRRGLVLAAAYLMVVVVVALEVPFALDIDHRATREYEDGLLQQTALLAGRINDDVPLAGTDPAVPPKPPAAIQGITDTAASTSSARFIVTDRLGRVLADSEHAAAVGTQYATAQRPELRAVFSIRGGSIDVRHRHSESAGGDLLLVTVPVIHFQEAVGAVRASAPLSSVRARVHRVWAGLGLIGAAVIMVGLALAWGLATKVSRPVKRLEEAAGRLGRGELDARAPVSGPKEVSALATSFNQMAGAVSANITAQRDFLGNASHQLRTPLTGLKLRLEAIQDHGGFAGEQARKAEGDVDRLSKLVDDLLEIASALSADSVGTNVDLATVAREAGERWSEASAAAGNSLHLRIDQPGTVWADPTDLAHVVDNLVENAIRYSPPGTDITLETGRRGGRAVLAVADTGPGIPEAERSRVFERFYRGSTGKKAGPGTGLGLAIVFELVRRWGGEIALADGAGTRFEATFPATSTLP
jgi:signal transduction histidine kinase